jgi:hypothetical protein
MLSVDSESVSYEAAVSDTSSLGLRDAAANFCQETHNMATLRVDMAVLTINGPTYRENIEKALDSVHEIPHCKWLEACQGSDRIEPLIETCRDHEFQYKKEQKHPGKLLILYLGALKRLRKMYDGLHSSGYCFRCQMYLSEDRNKNTRCCCGESFHEACLKKHQETLCLMKNTIECSICVESLSKPLNFITERELVETPCGHIFHFHCIEKWLLDDNFDCPNCRQNLHCFYSPYSRRL